MDSIIKLFKAVEVRAKPIKGERIPAISKALLEETVKKGFVFSSAAIYNYSNQELIDLVKVIERECGLTAEKMNSSFHKSWKKVKDADIVQLILEQLIHYFTTYGFERLGIYDEDSVYIPNEKLEIPELVEGIRLVVINGYTKEELRKKLLSLLQSGIALAESTLKDVVDLATYLDFGEEEISTVRNKEAKAMLYDYLDLVPKSPVEFLRFAVYKSTNKTLLIKDSATIAAIQEKDNLNVLRIFLRYENAYGFKQLAEIFYRFKPIFLAFRTNKRMKIITNRIRKLARKYHKPMPSDYLNEITCQIKHQAGQDWTIDKQRLENELNKANIFRKIRLAYALKFRTKDVHSILYKIRNGKGYATSFEFDEKIAAGKILNTVVDSIVADLDVKGKKFYIPDYMTYALPATEKQFTGDFPSGSYISMPKDMVVGIHWENVDSHRIDLDLSMVNSDGKFGWDSSYRSEDRTILFSGDITDARKPHGASELFYVARRTMSSYLLFVNYYNYDSEIEVPFKILVAQEQAKDFSKNYMVNPNNVLSVAKTKINQKQKILGLLVTTTKECRFYFAETYLGGSISSYDSEFAKHARQFLFAFYRNTINLGSVLKKAGAKMVDNKEESDIDLSPETLEKDKIIRLLSERKGKQRGDEK